MQTLLLKTCDLFSKIFEVFNEIEMEISFTNNKVFTNLWLKIRVREKEISYHFLVESKPHEKMDLLIKASVNIYQKKKEKKKYSNSNKNMLFWRKTHETIWDPLPFQLTPLFLSNFLITPLFVQISKISI